MLNLREGNFECTDFIKRAVEKVGKLKMSLFGCPDHSWSGFGCNLPVAVSKLSSDDLQTPLYFQTEG